MTLKNVANEDLTITVAVAVPPVAGAIITITSLPSVKCKAMGKGVYSGGIDVSILGATKVT